MFDNPLYRRIYLFKNFSESKLDPSSTWFQVTNFLGPSEGSRLVSLTLKLPSVLRVVVFVVPGDPFVINKSPIYLSHGHRTKIKI